MLPPMTSAISAQMGAQDGLHLGLQIGAYSGAQGHIRDLDHLGCHSGPLLVTPSDGLSVRIEDICTPYHLYPFRIGVQNEPRNGPHLYPLLKGSKSAIPTAEIDLPKRPKWPNLMVGSPRSPYLILPASSSPSLHALMGYIRGI